MGLENFSWQGRQKMQILAVEVSSYRKKRSFASHSKNKWLSLFAIYNKKWKCNTIQKKMQ